MMKLCANASASVQAVRLLSDIQYRSPQGNILHGEDVRLRRQQRVLLQALERARERHPRKEFASRLRSRRARVQCNQHMHFLCWTDRGGGGSLGLSQPNRDCTRELGTRHLHLGTWLGRVDTETVWFEDVSGTGSPGPRYWSGSGSKSVWLKYAGAGAGAASTVLGRSARIDAEIEWNIGPGSGGAPAQARLERCASGYMRIRSVADGLWMSSYLLVTGTTVVLQPEIPLRVLHPTPTHNCYIHRVCGYYDMTASASEYAL
jgi:hypothetical protein